MDIGGSYPGKSPVGPGLVVLEAERGGACRYHRDIPVGGLWGAVGGGGREIRLREIKAIIITGIFQ